jgi:hypothetical protein
MKERISPAIKAHLLRGGFYVILILTGTMLVFPLSMVVYLRFN